MYVQGSVIRRGNGPQGLSHPELQLPALRSDEHDRRRSSRKSESASGWLSNASGGAITSGRTVAINDLSLHGVGLTSLRPCQVGDRHWILITRGPLRLSTRVRVVSARKRADADGWDVGGEFF